MKNSRAAAMALLLSCASVSALAVERTPGKWYAGGSIGRGGYKTGYQRTADTIFSTGATSVTVVPDVTQTMWKLYAGYNLSPQFSIEGGYWNFGRPSYTANITAPVVTTMRRSFTAQGYGASLVYWLPVNDNFSAFGKVGGMLTNATASSADPGAGLGTLPAETARRLNWSFGLGAQYDFNANMSGRVEYEAVRKIGDEGKFGTANVGMWSVGLNYRY